MIREALIVVAFTCLPALALAQQPDQKPEPLVSAKIKQATGTIQAISQSDRHVVLQLKGGSPILLEAGDAVSNFDQVRLGPSAAVEFSVTSSALPTIPKSTLALCPTRGPMASHPTIVVSAITPTANVALSGMAEIVDEAILRVTMTNAIRPIANCWHRQLNCVTWAVRWRAYASSSISPGDHRLEALEDLLTQRVCRPSNDAPATDSDLPYRRLTSGESPAIQGQRLVGYDPMHASMEGRSYSLRMTYRW
jgi:hypothetical protein